MIYRLDLPRLSICKRLVNTIGGSKLEAGEFLPLILILINVLFGQRVDQHFLLAWL